MDVQQSFNIEVYLELIMELNKIKEQLAQTKKINKQLINQIQDLETELQKNNKITKEMTKNIERDGQRITSNIL